MQGRELRPRNADDVMNVGVANRVHGPVAQAEELGRREVAQAEALPSWNDEALPAARVLAPAPHDSMILSTAPCAHGASGWRPKYGVSHSGQKRILETTMDEPFRP